jgi:hypothetical protein
MYDWRTMEEAARSWLSELMASFTPPT